MTEQEVYKQIQPLLEGYTEGLYWDFKKTLSGEADIVKDILAFSNSACDGNSYIIVGVSESGTNRGGEKLALSTEDRRRLNTDANYIYLPGKWDIHGLSAADIPKMKQFSAKITEQINANMLISIPSCEFVPVQIKKSRWLYVIIIKKVPGVFVAKKDITYSDTDKKDKNVAIKQGVLYVRVADTTLGARTDVASATEHIRIWKNYIEWLNANPEY